MLRTAAGAGHAMGGIKPTPRWNLHRRRHGWRDWPCAAAGPWGLVVVSCLVFACPSAAPASAEETGAPAFHPFIGQQKRPLVIAHRGGAGEEPEHTIEAFRALRARHPSAVVELDVHLSRDGQVIVIHDETVDRTTDGTGEVSELSVAQLKLLDAGHCFSPRGDGSDKRGGTAPKSDCRANSQDPTKFPRRGKGYRVPTLIEALTAISPDAFVSVEVKSAGAEEKTAAILRSRHRLDRVAVGAMDGDIARRLTQLLPEAAHYAPVSTAVCYVSAAAVGKRPNHCARVDILAVSRGLTMARLIRLSHEMGVAVAPFTVNAPEEMRQLLNWGVTAIITDYPSRARQVIDDWHK